jgi:hypothetical protein
MSNMSMVDDNEAEALASYKNVTEIIKELHQSEDESDDYTYYDRVHEMVLSVDEKKIYEICLGTGGPGYHLNVQVSGSGNTAYIEKMSYTYLNWFYRKEMDIDKGSDDWDTWEEFATNFVEEWL